MPPPGKDQKSEWGSSFQVAPPSEGQAAGNDDMMTLAVLVYMAFCTPGAGGSAKKTRQGGDAPPFLRVFHQDAQWSMALWKLKTQPALAEVLRTIPRIAAGYKISGIADCVNWALRKKDNANELATVGQADHDDSRPVDVTRELLQAMRSLEQLEAMQSIMRKRVNANAHDVRVWQDEPQETWQPGLMPKCIRYDHSEGVYFELGCFKTRGLECTPSPAAPLPNSPVSDADDDQSMAMDVEVSSSFSSSSSSSSSSTWFVEEDWHMVEAMREVPSPMTPDVRWDIPLSPAQIAFADGFLRNDGGGTRSGAGGKGKGKSSWWDQGDESLKVAQKKTSPPAVHVLTYLATSIVSSVRGSWKLCWERMKMS